MARKAIATALAKTQAYTACGKHEEAATWAARLVVALGAADILLPHLRDL